jgi:hypothetical protein
MQFRLQLLVAASGPRDSRNQSTTGLRAGLPKRYKITIKAAASNGLAGEGRVLDAD